MKIKEYDYTPIGARIKKSTSGQKINAGGICRKKINVSCQFVSDMERGLCGVSLSALIEICKTFDVDADYILFGHVARDEGNPINKLLIKINRRQIQCAEDMLAAFTRGLGMF